MRKFCEDLDGKDGKGKCVWVGQAAIGLVSGGRDVVGAGCCGCRLLWVQVV